jgi:hypothetical protein
MSASRAHPSPYDLVFGAESIDDRLFPPIKGEAEARGVSLEDPERFVFLTGVGRLLQAIAGGEGDAEGEGPGKGGGAGEGSREGRGEAFRQHGRLLFHAFHFWRAGKVEVELDEALVRRLLDDDEPGGDRALATPAVAGYLRLPRNLIWAAPAPGERPEPADGFFWTFYPPSEAAPRALHLLMALGVRPDRPGFSVVTATGEVGAYPHWADVDARPGVTDFATTLPGGELDRLYSVETTAELLKLASRCFIALDRDGG